MKTNPDFIKSMDTTVRIDDDTKTAKCISDIRFRKVTMVAYSEAKTMPMSKMVDISAHDLKDFIMDQIGIEQEDLMKLALLRTISIRELTDFVYRYTDHNGHSLIQTIAARESESTDDDI